MQSDFTFKRTELYPLCKNEKMTVLKPSEIKAFKLAVKEDLSEILEALEKGYRFPTLAQQELKDSLLDRISHYSKRFA